MDFEVVSTDDTTLQLQQLSDFESFSDMSSANSSAFSDDVAPTKDGKGALQTPTFVGKDITTNHDESPITMLPALESFVPVIEHLPGLILEDDAYHIDRPLLKSDLQQLASYTRRIEQLTLTDLGIQDYPTVAPEILTRLALLQASDRPFLPSLDRLRLLDADKALEYLLFCITPSLKFLEISEVKANRQRTISYFLKELVLRVPYLSSITIGPGRISDSSLKSSLEFVHLQKLNIVDAAESLDFAFLREVSALPELETFMIDARAAAYEPCQSSSTSDSKIIPFRPLQKLTIVANVHLMGDIVYYLFPQEVKEVSLTLVQDDRALQQPLKFAAAAVSAIDKCATPDGDPQDAPVIQNSISVPVEKLPAVKPLDSFPSLISAGQPVIDWSKAAHEEQAETFTCHRCAETERKRLEEVETREKGEKMRQMEIELKRKMEEEEYWAANCKDDDIYESKTPISDHEEEESTWGSWGQPTCEQKAREEEQQAKTEAIEAAIREEARTSIIAQVSAFANLIEKFLSLVNLDTFFVDRLETSYLSGFISGLCSPSNPFEFPSSTLRALLSCSTLKDLKFGHWYLTNVNETLIDLATASEFPPSMSLKNLRLPVDKELNWGIAISTLPYVAHYYPHLIHFECLITGIDAAPGIQLDLGPKFVPHGLEVLSVGGGSPSTLKEKIAIATYLSLLFPALKSINTHEGYDAEDWEHIYSLIGMCQTVRADEKLRRGVAITI